jgi:hypothetical protein
MAERPGPVAPIVSAKGVAMPEAREASEERNVWDAVGGAKRAVQEWTDHRVQVAKRTYKIAQQWQNERGNMTKEQGLGTDRLGEGVDGPSLVRARSEQDERLLARFERRGERLVASGVGLSTEDIEQEADRFLAGLSGTLGEVAVGSGKELSVGEPKAQGGDAVERQGRAVSFQFSVPSVAELVGSDPLGGEITRAVARAEAEATLLRRVNEAVPCAESELGSTSMVPEFRGVVSRALAGVALSVFAAPLAVMVEVAVASQAAAPTVPQGVFSRAIAGRLIPFLPELAAMWVVELLARYAVDQVRQRVLGEPLAEAALRASLDETRRVKVQELLRLEEQERQRLSLEDEHDTTARWERLYRASGDTLEVPVGDASRVFPARRARDWREVLEASYPGVPRGGHPPSSLESRAVGGSVMGVWVALRHFPHRAGLRGILIPVVGALGGGVIGAILPPIEAVSRILLAKPPESAPRTFHPGVFAPLGGPVSRVLDVESQR